MTRVLLYDYCVTLTILTVLSKSIAGIMELSWNTCAGIVTVRNTHKETYTYVHT